MPAANPSWYGIYRDLSCEHGFEPLQVEGCIPDDLKGVLYRNGPARFSLANTPYQHWFDGDGAITAIRLNREKGSVEGACRLVNTPWFQKEQAAGRSLYRGYAHKGQGWRGLGLPRNPANISVLPWNQQLLALWDAGRPIELNPDTLDTLGETRLNGVLGPAFSAHPHKVGDTLFNFGVRPGLHFSLDLYALSDKVQRIGSIPLPRPTAIHDFIATPHYLIFFCPPLRLHLARLIAGMGSYNANLVWEPEHGTEVIVMPLNRPDRPVRFTVPTFFQWHFINAWEETDGTLTVDYVPYDDFKTDAWFGRAPYDPPVPPPASRYARARINLAAKRMDVEILANAACEFPALHPCQAGQCHDVCWLLSFETRHGSDGLHPVLCCFEPHSGMWRTVPLGVETFPSEAVVVPGNEKVWILSLVYDGVHDKSFLAIIDGARPEAGPVARAWFNHAIPLTFHGAWAGA